MNSKDLFKSRKFIVLFSMAINVIFILIGSFGFENNYNHLELSLILLLSLLLGPYSILGFTIVEILYWILFLDLSNIPTIIMSFTSLLVVGIMPWKLWYSLNYKQHYEIPSLNSFYSFFKIIDIGLVTILLTYLFFNQIFNKTVSLNLESYFMIITFGIVMLLLGIGIFGKFNIATYTPTVQFKEYFPEKLYRLCFILALILLIVTNGIPNEFCFILILILLIIYLFKPFDEGIFKISNVEKITIFYNLFFSIFLIIALIPTILLVSFTLIGFYDYDLASEFFNYLIILSGFLLAIFIPLLIYFLFLDNQLIKPINQLSRYLSEEINNHDDLKRLVANLNSIKVNNEVKSLSESLLNMEREYIDYSANLLDVTKETERYETELKLANEIQYSMIPTDFQRFDDNNNVLLWGSMKAAREVGGDFYDYFKIDDDHIGFVIGDVSGKGVATALIMVKSMTLIRDYVTHYSELSQALYEVNNVLCNHNDIEELFVGCWIGKLNTKTGELSYVNAGHKNPLIKQNDGNFESLDIKPGLLLAGMENMHYEEHIIHLKHDDMLFLYTDGVTLAHDGNGLYGEERLQKILNQNKDNKLSDILKSVENDVSEFCNNNELVDDTTMLIIKMK